MHVYLGVSTLYLCPSWILSDGADSGTTTGSPLATLKGGGVAKTVVTVWGGEGGQEGAAELRVLQSLSLLLSRSQGTEMMPWRTVETQQALSSLWKTRTVAWSIYQRWSSRQQTWEAQAAILCAAPAGSVREAHQGRGWGA